MQPRTQTLVLVLPLAVAQETRRRCWLGRSLLGRPIESHRALLGQTADLRTCRAWGRAERQTQAPAERCVRQHCQHLRTCIAATLCTNLHPRHDVHVRPINRHDGRRKVTVEHVQHAVHAHHRAAQTSVRTHEFIVTCQAARRKVHTCRRAVLPTCRARRQHWATMTRRQCRPWLTFPCWQRRGTCHRWRGTPILRFACRAQSSGSVGCDRTGTEARARRTAGSADLSASFAPVHPPGFHILISTGQPHHAAGRYPPEACSRERC